MRDWMRRIAAGAVGLAAVSTLSVVGAEAASASNDAVTAGGGGCPRPLGCSRTFNDYQSCHLDSRDHQRYYEIILQCYQMDDGRWVYMYVDR
ncbi:hypothetical protein GCM10023192_39560 [Amycolatopsis samaneae]